MLHRGILRSFDPATWTASVQVLGSHATYAEGVPVAADLAGGLLTEGSYVLVGSLGDGSGLILIDAFGSVPGAWITAGMMASVLGHHGNHEVGGSDAIVIKLDDLASPDDNTDLDGSTTRHGLVPKAPGDTKKYLRGDMTWALAGGGGSAIYARDMTTHTQTGGTLTAWTFTLLANALGSTSGIRITHVFKYNPSGVGLNATFTASLGTTNVFNAVGLLRTGSSDGFYKLVWEIWNTATNAQRHQLTYTWQDSSGGSTAPYVSDMVTSSVDTTADRTCKLVFSLGGTLTSTMMHAEILP